MEMCLCMMEFIASNVLNDLFVNWREGVLREGSEMTGRGGFINAK